MTDWKRSHSHMHKRRNKRREGIFDGKRKSKSRVAYITSAEVAPLAAATVDEEVEDALPVLLFMGLYGIYSFSWFAWQSHQRLYLVTQFSCVSVYESECCVCTSCLRLCACVCDCECKLPSIGRVRRTSTSTVSVREASARNRVTLAKQTQTKEDERKKKEKALNG